MIDLDRLARAVHLDVQRIGNGAWIVTGGVGTHVVSGMSDCDCRDHEVRGGPCKHRLAVALRTGDVETLLTLRQLVPLPPRAQRHRAGLQSPAESHR